MFTFKKLAKIIANILKDKDTHFFPNETKKSMRWKKNQ